jgi:uncharacterized protein (TIGR03066 family)
MKRTAVILFVAVALAAVRVFAAPVPSPAFDQIKALVGHWQEATPTDAKATMDIELTAAGTVVLERFHMIQEGKAVDMTTMYYLDGDQLKMTHYCEAGNQPTMRAAYDAASKTITFNFINATNLKSPNDGHMYHAVYTFLDHDHFQTRWTFRKDQKDAFTEDTVYVRAK